MIEGDSEMLLYSACQLINCVSASVSVSINVMVGSKVVMVVVVVVYVICVKLRQL